MLVQASALLRSPLIPRRTPVACCVNMLVRSCSACLDHKKSPLLVPVKPDQFWKDGGQGLHVLFGSRLLWAGENGQIADNFILGLPWRCFVVQTLSCRDAVIHKCLVPVQNPGREVSPDSPGGQPSTLGLPVWWSFWHHVLQSTSCCRRCGSADLNW